MIATVPTVAIPITEPVYVPDVPATELVAVTENDLGVCLAFAFTREAIGTTPGERVIVCRLVLPRTLYKRYFAVHEIEAAHAVVSH